jgi:hypothetical protein
MGIRSGGMRVLRRGGVRMRRLRGGVMADRGRMLFAMRRTLGAWLGLRMWCGRSERRGIRGIVTFQIESPLLSVRQLGMKR